MTERGSPRRPAQSRLFKFKPHHAAEEPVNAPFLAYRAVCGVTDSEDVQTMDEMRTAGMWERRSGATGHHGDVAAKIHPTATAREPVTGEGHQGPLMTYHSAEQPNHRAPPP